VPICQNTRDTHAVLTAQPCACTAYLTLPVQPCACAAAGSSSLVQTQDCNSFSQAVLQQSGFPFERYCLMPAWKACCCSQCLCLQPPSRAGHLGCFGLSCPQQQVLHHLFPCPFPACPSQPLRTRPVLPALVPGRLAAIGLGDTLPPEPLLLRLW